MAKIETLFWNCNISSSQLYLLLLYIDLDFGVHPFASDFKGKEYAQCCWKEFRESGPQNLGIFFSLS